MSDPTKIDGREPNTNMTAPPPVKNAMVKVRAKRDFQHHRELNAIGVRKGDVIEVTEAEAKELCRPLKGQYSFLSGQRQKEEVTHHDMTMAERVA